MDYELTDSRANPKLIKMLTTGFNTMHVAAIIAGIIIGEEI